MTNAAIETPAIEHSSPFSKMALIVAAGMAQMLVAIDFSATAITLPRMAEDFKVSADSLQWVLTGYMLSFSVTLAIAGPLGDRFGRKRFLLLGILLFAGISAWVGFAGSVLELIISRIALGIGGGLLFPLSVAVVGASWSREELPKVMCILTGVAMIGLGIGPVVGGVLTEMIDWRWVYFINLPISAIAFLSVMFLARESWNPDARAGSIDVPGILLLTLGIGALSVGIAEITNRSVATSSSIICGSVLILLLFGWYELRQKFPLIDLRLLGNRTFAGFLIGGSLSNGCWGVLVFVTTLYLQEIQKEDPMSAGLHFLYLSIPVVVAGFIGPFIQRRTSTRFMLLLALAIQTAACGIFWMSDASPWLAVGLLVAGFGCSWGWSMSQAGSIITIPAANLGLASGSIMTVLIVSRNMAIVISATMIKGLGGPSKIDYGPGITASFLFALGLTAVGFIAVFLIVPRIRSEPSS
jgi:MFS family permease